MTRETVYGGHTRNGFGPHSDAAAATTKTPLQSLRLQCHLTVTWVLTVGHSPAVNQSWTSSGNTSCETVTNFEAFIVRYEFRLLISASTHCNYVSTESKGERQPKSQTRTVVSSCGWTNVQKGFSTTWWLCHQHAPGVVCLPIGSNNNIQYQRAVRACTSKTFGHDI